MNTFAIFLARYAWMQVGCPAVAVRGFRGFRRTAVVEVGGFDDACFVEDYELVARMHRYAGEHGLDWRFRVLGTAQARPRRRGLSRLSGAAAAMVRRLPPDPLVVSGDGRRLAIRRAGHRHALPVKTADTVAPLYGLAAVGLAADFGATRQFDVLGPILMVLVGRLVVDMVFQVWALRRYRRWVGDTGRELAECGACAGRRTVDLHALLPALLGALYWLVRVPWGGRRWGRQKRFGLDPPEVSHRARRPIRPPLG